MLTELIPSVYLDGKPGVDLQALLRVVDEQWGELRQEAAQFPLTTHDPAATRLVDSWLSHNGNPIPLQFMTYDQQRSLISVLLWAHRNRGLIPSIVKVVKAVLNLDIFVQEGFDIAWSLGVDKLEGSTSLMDSRGGNVLLVSVFSDLADSDVVLLRAILDYIKPVNQSYRLEVSDTGFGLGSFGYSSFGG